MYLFVDRGAVWSLEKTFPAPNRPRGAKDAAITVIKASENECGFVIRVVEQSAQHGCVAVTLRPELTVETVTETDLLERPIEGRDLKIERDEAGRITAFSFALNPQEIVTFLIGNR